MMIQYNAHDAAAILLQCDHYLEQSSNPALMERWGFTPKHKLQTDDQWEFQAHIDSL